MKRTSLPLFTFLLTSVTLFSQSNLQQATSINQNGTLPDPSAMLDVQATDKGVLVPRMTSAQRTAIPFPATGLLVFDTNTGGFWFHNGVAWTNLSSQGASIPNQIADSDGDTKVQTEKNPNENIIRFDLAGTEHLVLRRNASGTPRLEMPNILSNTFVGQGAGSANTTGENNVASGTNALSSNATGSNNIAIGMDALRLNTTGYDNTAVGSEAMRFNTTGEVNTAIGRKALFTNTTGFSNTAIGSEALRENTTGSSNTATGRFALLANTTGYSNTANGAFALRFNTTGSGNSAFGNFSLHSNTIGFSNTAIGAEVLVSNTSGNNNVAIGSSAMVVNSTGSGNTATGNSSLNASSTGSNNTAIGMGAVRHNTTGSGNTGCGHNTLFFNEPGSNNTAIGNNADVSGSAQTNSTTIGNGTTVNLSNKVRIGNSSVTVIEGQVAYSFPSDARFKFNIQDGQVPGLALITQLRPVTYQFDSRKFDEHLMQHFPDTLRRQRIEGQDYSESSTLVQTGFLAQEVEHVCKDLGFSFSGLHVPVNEVDNYGLAYSSFVPLLVKAIQEQQAVIDGLASEIERLKNLERQLEKVTAALQGLGVELR